MYQFVFDCIYLHCVYWPVLPTVCILLCLLELTWKYLHVLVCIVWPVLHVVVCIDVAASIDSFHNTCHIFAQYTLMLAKNIHSSSVLYCLSNHVNAIITVQTLTFSINFDFQPKGWSEGKTMIVGMSKLCIVRNEVWSTLLHRIGMSVFVPQFSTGKYLLIHNNTYICTAYNHNTCQYVSSGWICVLNQSSIGMFLVCILVCISMYLPCIGHVMACIKFRFSALVFALRIHIGMYFGIYLACIVHVFTCIETQFVLNCTFRPYWNKYMSCIRWVFLCIGMYQPVFACIPAQIQCRHSSSVPYCLSIHVYYVV